MIGIIDYGMGNLHSVSKALERLAIPYFISGNGEELAKAKALILPGVGAFPDAMDILTQTNVQPFLDNWVAENKPLLGICLGMQLLFESSTEHQTRAGLGYLPGHVERFSGTTAEGHAYKVPHMGWNKLDFHRPTPLTEGVPDGYVYFVHSYVVRTEKDIVVASSDYYQRVPAIVQKGQVYGMQFHPEKSSTVGMALLKRFGQLVEGN